MATKTLSRGLQTLRASIGFPKDPLTQCLAPRFSRSMATEAPIPAAANLSYSADPSMFSNNRQELSSSPICTGFPGHLRSQSDGATAPDVLTTIYRFPSMEPLRFEHYPAKHLHLPLRRDILHRAVIYEGDAARQGTASSKTRFEVHGGHRKIRPQKGSGRARLGTRQSPMLRGGGKSFGPHPRDFSTELPRKMYDLAWRTALSYRYRKGELIVCEDGMEIEYPKTRFIKEIFQHNHWGNDDGRTLVITGSFRKNLFRALRHAGEDGQVKMEADVDVKDLLELGRIVIEKRALDSILLRHQSDISGSVPRAT